MACAVAALGQAAFAGSAEGTFGWAITTWSVAQAESAPTAQRRREADQLLKRAREAMRQGSLNEAEQLVRSAEALNVPYESLFARFVDTPEKARRDLNELVQQREGEARRPSRRFAPSDTSAAASEARPPQDPFSVPGLPPDPGRVANAAADRAATAPAPGLMPSDITSTDLQRLPLVPGNAARASLTDRSPFAEAAALVPGPPLAGDVNAAKQQVLRLLATAQVALDKGDLAAAQQMAQQAAAMRVPDSVYAAGEPRPWEVLLRVEQAFRRYGSGVVPAGHVTDAPGGENAPAAEFPVTQGVYRPGADRTRIELAQSGQSGPPAPPSPGMRLYQQGVQALEAQDRQAALQRFREAWQFEAELDPATRQQLKDKLSLLTAPAPNGVERQEPSRLQTLDAQQDLLRQKLFREVTSAENEARQIMQSDPMGALEHLQRLRDRVAQSDLDPAARKQLLTLADRQVSSMQAFINQHREEIELDERNRAVREEIDRDRATTIEVQEKVAELV
jgi:general secretion pathway protein D